jgi:hypothetical protein
VANSGAIGSEINFEPFQFSRTGGLNLRDQWLVGPLLFLWRTNDTDTLIVSEVRVKVGKMPDTAIWAGDKRSFLSFLADLRWVPSVLET